MKNVFRQKNVPLLRIIRKLCSALMQQRCVKSFCEPCLKENFVSHRWWIRSVSRFDKAKQTHNKVASYDVVFRVPTWQRKELRKTS